MRFMIFVKASKDSEAGVMPIRRWLPKWEIQRTARQRRNHAWRGGPSRKRQGCAVNFSKDKRMVVDGPFAQTKELIAGFWIWRCKSLQEAVEWAERPNPTGEEGQLEIRQIMEMEDFQHVDPALIEHEKQTHARAKELAERKGEIALHLSRFERRNT